MPRSIFFFPVWDSSPPFIVKVSAGATCLQEPKWQGDSQVHSCTGIECIPDNPETTGPLLLQGNVLLTPTTSELPLSSSPSTGKNAWKSKCCRVHYEENTTCLPSLPPTSSKLVSLIMLYILSILSGKIHCKCIWLNKYMVNKHFSCPFYW